MNNSETRDQGWIWRNILGGVIVVYIVLIIFAPLWFNFNDNQEQMTFPGKLGTPEIILISLGFLFNSGIVERLRKLQVSATEVSSELNAVSKNLETAQSRLESIREEMINKLARTSFASTTDEETGTNLLKLSREINLADKEIKAGSEKIHHVKRIFD